MEKPQNQAERGFTLVEILIALAVGALLVTAVMVAFNSAAVNYKENAAIAESMNKSRQFLYKLLSQLRTAQSVDNVTNTECSFRTDDGSNLSYIYDGNNVYLDTTPDDSSDSNYLVCENISDIQFTKVTADGDPNSIESIRVDIQITRDGKTRTLSAGTSLRKNLD